MKSLEVAVSTSTRFPYLPEGLGTEILREVMKFRRMVGAHSACNAATCQLCLEPHLRKVTACVLQGRPILFVLPAFPGKSPNQAKVLGVLPDMAERKALQFLNTICERVKQIYSPGAKIILCSDGRVFSDVIGMKEEDVTAYQFEISRLIEELNLTHLSTFDLDELSFGENFTELRRELMERFGRSKESLREKVLRGGQGSESAEDQEAHRMFCGITRFLVEDSMHPAQTKSRTAIQKDCRLRAYEVILRSNAWSELIAAHFPQAVRLSIHPQTCGAQKLGIQLLGTESWLTPWHGVAVETMEGFHLMKRWEAEQRGAELVVDSEGRASHFRIM